ncbi:MAG: hypothetical protein AB7K68_14545 [Bacteriovoracia bacterium]
MPKTFFAVLAFSLLAASSARAEIVEITGLNSETSSFSVGSSKSSVYGMDNYGRKRILVREEDGKNLCSKRQRDSPKRPGWPHRTRPHEKLPKAEYRER